MTIAGLRRKWPSLVRRAERDLGKRFKNQPTLRLVKTIPRDVAQNDLDYYEGSDGKPERIVYPRVYMRRRMVRDYEPLAEAIALHELRENLALQHGSSLPQAHREALDHRRKDVKRLGLRQLGWELRDYYGDRRRQPRALRNPSPYSARQRRSLF